MDATRKDPRMQAYKVIGRSHRRTSTVTQMALAPDGTRLEIKQAGPLVTYQVGDVIEDIRRDELEAFPDRFAPATSAEVDAWHERQAQLPTVMRAPGLSAQQAEEHAKLTQQIEELQAKQQALLLEAQTPVPTELPIEAPSGAPTPSPTHEGPAGRGPHTADRGTRAAAAEEKK